MGFLDSYKRLDNLCKDLLGTDKGVSRYIEELERCERIKFQIGNWHYDYDNLKRLRHIRNLIVHENDVTEDNLCDVNDIKWIEDFHQKIINQKDPLAQYQKLINEINQQQCRNKHNKSQKNVIDSNRNNNKDQNTYNVKLLLGIVGGILVGGLLCVLIVVCFLLCL